VNLLAAHDGRDISYRHRQIDAAAVL